MSLLSEILSSKVRAEIFRILFGLGELEVHMRELERRSGFTIGTIQTELKKLLSLDLVVKRKDGNRSYFSANKTHPLYQDIRSMVLKTAGLVDILKGALQDQKDIQLAFVFGSIARNQAMAESDIDLFIIGDTGLRNITILLSGPIYCNCSVTGEKVILPSGVTSVILAIVDLFKTTVCCAGTI